MTQDFKVWHRLGRVETSHNHGCVLPSLQLECLATSHTNVTPSLECDDLLPLATQALMATQAVTV